MAGRSCCSASHFQLAEIKFYDGHGSVTINGQSGSFALPVYKKTAAEKKSRRHFLPIKICK
jgi:hypothetical protein